jgi:hypothetical protein
MIKSRRMKWAGHVALTGEKKNADKILEGKPETKRPLERPRCRWVDNVKMDLREIGRGGMGWIDVALDRDQWTTLVNTAMNHRVEKDAANFFNGYTICGFSRRAQLHGVSLVSYEFKSLKG